MEIDKLPFVGKVHKTLNSLVLNFVLLGMICLSLAVIIPMYPEVLGFLVSALLVIASLILFNMAYHIHTSKKRYFDWMDK